MAGVRVVVSLKDRYVVGGAVIACLVGLVRSEEWERGNPLRANRRDHAQVICCAFIWDASVGHAGTVCKGMRNEGLKVAGAHRRNL